MRGTSMNAIVSGCRSNGNGGPGRGSYLRLSSLAPLGSTSRMSREGRPTTHSAHSGLRGGAVILASRKCWSMRCTNWRQNVEEDSDGTQSSMHVQKCTDTAVAGQAWKAAPRIGSVL